MLHREGRCHFGCSFLCHPFISASGSHPNLVKQRFSKKSFSKILEIGIFPPITLENIFHGMNLQGKLILKAVEIPFQVFSAQFHNMCNLFKLWTRMFQSSSHALLFVSTMLILGFVKTVRPLMIPE